MIAKTQQARAFKIDRARFLSGSGGFGAPVIYVIDAVDHPFPVEEAAAGLAVNVVTLPVEDWDGCLTPWPAEALYPGEEAFGGRAAETLAEFTSLLPELEAKFGLSPVRRGICGYSLGGLFALYAFLQSEIFCACGALSPSVWYEGWLEFLAEEKPRLDSRFAYLSVGSKEKRARNPRLQRVEDNLQETAALLRACGCGVQVEIGPGNHMQHIPERFRAGLEAVAGYLV